MASTPRRRLVLALVVTLSLLAAACGSDVGAEGSAEAVTTTSAAIAEEPTTTTAPTTSAPTTTIPEAELDPLADVREEITEILTAWQAENGAPAVSFSVRLPGADPINIATGVADLTTDEPVTTDDYFRIGSISKSVTAAVVLQLVDEGLIELDEPVQTYLPDWLDGYEYASEITIRQLMDHTNGLREYAFDPEFYAIARERLDVAAEPEEIIDWLAGTDPLFAPGEQYSYETGGFLTLGRVIEGVTGNSAAAEIRTRIFEPAGAENIFLSPDENPPSQIVNGYNRELLYFATTTLIGFEDTSGLMVNGEPVSAVLSYPQEFLRSSGWTGGGLEAKPESVSAIFMAMFDGTILSDELIDEMTTQVLDVNYGLGISNDVIGGTTVYSHGGGVPGFRSQAGYLPEHGISYAVSSSLIPLPEGAGVGDLQQQLVPVLVEAMAAV